MTNIIAVRFLLCRDPLLMNKSSPVNINSCILTSIIINSLKDTFVV